MFKPGDKVFVKVKGFRHWPCRINPLPEGVIIPKGKYPVFFYGSHEVMFVTAKDIFPFHENFEKWGKVVKNGPLPFTTGMMEIENRPTIYEFGKDEAAETFLAQFYDFEKPMEVYPGPLHSTKQTKQNSSRKSLKRFQQIDIYDSPPPSKIPHIELSSPLAVPDEISISSSLSAADGSIFVSDSVFIHDEVTPTAASATSDSSPNQIDTVSVPNDSLAYTDSIGDSALPQVVSANPVNESNVASMPEIESNFKKEKDPKSIERDVKRGKKGQSKKVAATANEKKFQSIIKDRSSKLESKLHLMNITIKSSLVRGNEDYPRCLTIMKELKELPMRLSHLAYCWDLMETLKKCRKYRLNEEIKSTAQHLYNKFLEMHANATQEELGIAQRCIQEYHQQKKQSSERILKKEADPISQHDEVKSNYPPIVHEMTAEQQLMECSPTVLEVSQELSVEVTKLPSTIRSPEKPLEKEADSLAPTLTNGANNDGVNEEDDESFVALLSSVPGFELVKSTLGFDSPDSTKQANVLKCFMTTSRSVPTPIETDWPTQLRELGDPSGSKETLKHLELMHEASSHSSAGSYAPRKSLSISSGKSSTNTSPRFSPQPDSNSTTALLASPRMELQFTHLLPSMPPELSSSLPIITTGLDARIQHLLMGRNSPNTSSQPNYVSTFHDVSSHQHTTDEDIYDMLGV